MKWYRMRKAYQEKGINLFNLKRCKKTIFPEKISSTLALFLFNTEQVRTDANRREIFTAYEKT